VSLHRFKMIALASALAVAGPTAAIAADQALAPIAAAPIVSIPTAGSVSALYDQYKLKPIWFKNGGPSVAVTQLTQILRRARLDGLSNGPELAVQIENAVRAASSGNPADVAAAEQTISAAWVLYVQTIKRPTPGMIYQFRVTSFRDRRGSAVAISRSEDLRGVFSYE